MRIMEKVVHVYVLCDPRTPEKIRYIGKTTRKLSNRLKEHMTEAFDVSKTTRKLNWIRSIVAAGMSPQINLVVDVIISEWEETERRFISEYKKAGHDLTNSTEGGDGMGIPTEETRMKISAALKGRTLSPEHCAKLLAYHKGRKMPLQACINMSVAKKNQTAETRAKISAALTGKKHSLETRAKLSAALSGRKQSPEVIAHRALANTGKKRTPETCAKISATNKGRKPSTEAIARSAEAHRGKKQSAETIEKRVSKLRGKKMPPGTGAKRWATRRANALAQLKSK